MQSFGMINSTGAGFFSNFRGSVAAIKRCVDSNMIPYMNWTTNPYVDPRHGNNSWEYYFKPLSVIPRDGVFNKYNIEQDFTWRNQPWARETMNQLITDYVRLQPDIEMEINNFYNENMKDQHVLGVHIRLTDKGNHPKESQTIVGYDNYRYEIEKYFAIFPEAKAYISTDSTDYIPFLERDFGDKLIINPDITRSSGGKSIHHHLGGSGFKKGKDVLMECILLSRCNFLIKGVSNVALCSLFFNKDLEHFNITSKYRGDTREDFIPYKNITEEQLCQ